MAFLSFKTLSFFLHNLLIIIIYMMLDFHQRMVNQIDYDYYKSRGLFFLFGLYAFISSMHLLIKLLKENDIRKYHKEKLKSQIELRKYLENKNKKQNENI